MRPLMLVVCAALAVACTSVGEVPKAAPSSGATSEPVVSANPTVDPTAVPTSPPEVAPTSTAGPSAPAPTRMPEPTPTPARTDPLAAPADGRLTVPDDPVAVASLLTAADEAIRDPEAPSEVVA